MPRSKRTIQKDLNEAHGVVARLQAELVEALRRTRVPCCRCGRKTVVSSLTFVQTHWYDDNTGSPNGGYWRRGEGQFECPKCGHVNRPINSAFDFEALKPYFKEVTNEHKRHGFWGLSRRKEPHG